jgi:hypothetical protein
MENTITITTNWLDGYTVKNNELVIDADYLEQQEQHGVEFTASPTDYRGLHRGAYFDVTGTPESLKSWWVESYNGLNDGETFHSRQFDNRLGNELTPWGSINFESDQL